ncbi:MAG: crossover junction endodeoxyribonuclease RuvC [Saprospiraceae bacterium]
MRNRPQPIRYIGIDPGTNVMGYAVIQVVGKQIRLVHMGVIKMNPKSEQQEKLHKILVDLQTLIDRYEPTEMAIEAPFFGKNVQAMLKLGRAQGVAMAAGMTKGLNVTEYAPRKIKQSVTGNGNASKEQVAAMLQQILKVDLREEFLDATDALGVAVCHFYQNGSRLGGSKKYSGWAGFINDNKGRVKS